MNLPYYFTIFNIKSYYITRIILYISCIVNNNRRILYFGIIE